MHDTASPLTELTHIALSLDALNCGALLVSRSGIIAHVNCRLCELMNRPRQELIGSELVYLYPPDESRDVVRAMLAQFDKAREAEFFLPRNAGERVPIVFSARPVGEESVLSEYAVITMIDISRQKLAERKLTEQNRQIGELSDRVMEQAAALREYADSLEQRVVQRTEQLHEAHMETMYMLAIASEAKDQDTGDHVRRIRRYSQVLAEQMGMTPSDAQRLGNSAVLHDVGKIHVPDNVLKKPGPLTADERTIMRSHTIAGERILHPSPYFTQASQIARSHHENFDGSGYPDGLHNAQIPLEARIVHIVDVYDALTHRRVYKPAWTHEQAMEEIQLQTGRVFDPAISAVFTQVEAKGELHRVREQVAKMARG